MFTKSARDLLDKPRNRSDSPKKDLRSWLWLISVISLMNFQPSDDLFLHVLLEFDCQTPSDVSLVGFALIKSILLLRAILPNLSFLHLASTPLMSWNPRLLAVWVYKFGLYYSNPKSTWFSSKARTCTRSVHFTFIKLKRLVRNFKKFCITTCCYLTSRN